jgi:adenylate kinase
MQRIILFGAPGSGKGTQANSIEKRYGLIKISTGDLVRAEIKSDSEIGRRIKIISEGGGLVPDDTIIEILKKRIHQPDIRKGYIMDGFPRTIAQARALDGIPTDSEIVIFLKVSEETVVKRLMSRLTCSECGAIFNSLNNAPRKENLCDFCGAKLMQRQDDNEEAIRNRLAVFHRETEPVIHHYRVKGVLAEVDGSQDTEDVFHQIEGLIN